MGQETSKGERLSISQALVGNPENSPNKFLFDDLGKSINDLECRCISAHKVEVRVTGTE